MPTVNAIAPREAAPSGAARRSAAALALALLLSGCGGSSLPPRDTAYVEILRLNVTRVRNATQQTRAAIVRSRGGPYEAELYLRLAELLSEEARYHYRIAVEREQRTDQAIHVPQVRLLKEQAIGIYERILRVTPNSPLVDRALFNMGFEHRELQNFDDMAEALQRLVDEREDSPLRPHALIMLGDYHRDGSRTDEARRDYQLAARGDSARMQELAHYRLAWLRMGQTNCRGALEEFVRALVLNRRRQRRERAEERARREQLAGEEADEDASLAEDEDAAGDDGEAEEEEDEQPTFLAPGIGAAGDPPDDLVSGDVEVGRSALTDMAYCYTQERQANGVLRFLRQRSQNRATYVAALERFARRYSVSSDPLGTILVTRELLRYGPASGGRLDDIRGFHTALRTAEDWTRIGEDVELMHRAFVAHVARREVTRPEEERLREEFEVYSRDLLTRAQLALPAGPEERRRNRAGSVARGYASHLDTFPQSEEGLAVLQNLVDVLGISGQQYEAGRRSLELADRLEEGDEERDALYDAVVAFQEALGDEGPPLDPRQRVGARGALRLAARQLLAYELPEERQRRVKFAMALTLYDEGRYQAAIDRFTALAYEYPQSEESTASVRLVLDSYNTLNDYMGLLHAGQRFLGDGSPITASVQSEVQQVVAQAEQRMVDELSLEAAGDEGGDLQVLVSFAEERPGSSLGERALLNAFVAARATGDVDQLYDLGTQIAEAYPQSDQLPGIVSTLGQMALARFDADRAVEFLARAAAANVEQRARLLASEGLLLEQLGRPDEAIERYQQAVQAARTAADRSEPLDRLADLAERRGEGNRILSAVGPHVNEAPFEAVARYGLAQIAAGQGPAAEGTLQGVLAASGSASQVALARAHFGSAEILNEALTSYPELVDFTLIEEFVAVVDVVQQTYLNAARQGDPAVTPAAFARLAHVLRTAASRLESVPLGSMFSGDELQAVQGALQQRVATLRQTAEEAVAACARQAFELPTMNAAARACLAGQAQEQPGLRFDRPAQASRGQAPSGVDELRDRLSRNAEDVEALLELGTRYLDAGNAAGAALIFAAAVERDGGAPAHNLLGIARAQMGDLGLAMEAFARAADAGLEAGRQNLATMLRQNGGPPAAEAALTQYEEGRAGGRLLSGGGA
ncbi:MAG: hypothetical protein ACFCGT_03200 [Sandaracinaceae bacterium]